MTTTNDRRRRTSASVVSSSKSRFPRALVLALFMMRGGVSGGFETEDESNVDEIIIVGRRTSFYSRPEYASAPVELEPTRRRRRQRRRRRLIEKADEREEEDENHLKPEQVHLSISGDEEVTVVWTTREPLEEDFEVRYACAKRNSEDEEEKDVIYRVVS